MHSRFGRGDGKMLTADIQFLFALTRRYPALELVRLLSANRCLFWQEIWLLMEWQADCRSKISALQECGGMLGTPLRRTGFSRSSRCTAGAVNLDFLIVHGRSRSE